MRSRNCPLRTQAFQASSFKIGVSISIRANRFNFQMLTKRMVQQRRMASWTNLGPALDFSPSTNDAPSFSREPLARILFDGHFRAEWFGYTAPRNCYSCIRHESLLHPLKHDVNPCENHSIRIPSIAWENPPGNTLARGSLAKLRRDWRDARTQLRRPLPQERGASILIKFGSVIVNRE